MIRQCYVAGSYTAGTHTAGTHTAVLANISKALGAACALAAHGLTPIVPHTMGSHRVDWDTAMERCKLAIMHMDPAKDCLVLLPGWEQSPGARAEVTFAEHLGIPVLTLQQALEVRP